MEREIKFRVWTGQKMCYSDPHLQGSNGHLEIVTIYTGYEDSDEWDNYKFMQYTGLKDNNATDIYEGDIVETPLGNITEIQWGRCEESKGDSTYEYTGFVSRFDGCNFHLDHTIVNGEVIGNIYENTELL